MAAAFGKPPKDKTKTLACALCLEVFTRPKLLPCFHTFCETCLENLASGQNSSCFPCPSCRTPIDVPSGGVSAFQNNFYIDQDDLEKARYGLFCTLHLSRELELFCQDCDKPICFKCKMTDHHSHQTSHLQVTAVPTSKEKEAVKDKQCQVRQAILNRVAILKAAVERYQEEALASLDEITDAISDSLTASWVKEISRPVLRYNAITDSVLERLRGWIGTVARVDLPVSVPDVTVEERFQCQEKMDFDIYHLCPLTDNKVWVSYEPYSTASVLFDACGKSVDTVTCDIPGNVTVQRTPDSDVMFYLPDEDCSNTGAKRCESDMVRHFRLLNDCKKQATVFMESVKSTKPLHTERKDIFTINCLDDRAFDVSSSEQYFVVLEVLKPPVACKRRVQLYRPTQPDPVATYTAPSQPFLPSDVCFYTLGGQEVLLVADELNDTIHVVNVQEDKLTFLRYLAPGCPLLVQPTALNTDMEGRLWVACRGGRILTCSPTSS